MDKKTCKGKCKANKPLNKFYFYGGYYDGECKECRKTKHKQWAKKNARHLREYLRHLYHTNPGHRKVCIECSYRYRHDPANKQHIKQVKQALAVKHRKDPKNRILSNLRRRFLFVLKGHQKSDHTLNLIGCSREQLIKHIEFQFKDGMSWDNYGRVGWHVDHRIPCDFFDLSNPEEQRKCFHYTNLQPLWWQDNYRKGSRCNQHQQPPIINRDSVTSRTGRLH